MGRLPFKLASTVVGMLLAGCAAPPWATRHSDDTKPAPAPQPASAPKATSPGTAGTAPNGLDMQEVMAELRQAGEVDPAAQEKLIADLLQTDPSLRPMVFQQFRALVAYRRQAERRDPAGEGGAPAGPREAARPPQAEVSVRGPGKTGTGHQPIIASPGDNACREGSTTILSGGLNVVGVSVSSGGPTPARAAPVSSVAATLPDMLQSPKGPTKGAKTAETRPGEGLSAIVATAARSSDPVTTAATGLAPAVKDAEVVRTSHETPLPTDWQAHLAEAIREMEQQAKGKPNSEAEIAQQARLRMLYLLAGRREDALRPVPGLQGGSQNFWSQQLYALATWLDTEHTPDGTRRAAETKRILSDAMVRLSETAPLVVRNLAFCTSVQSYGSITPFKKCEFAPGQELLLYAEVDNFASEPTPKGFHTSLKSSYQIFDSRAQRVAEYEFAVIEEVCQSPRRDFFLGYHLRLPKRIYPGKHKLQLTVEDLKSRKVGQATIELVVKGEE